MQRLITPLCIVLSSVSTCSLLPACSSGTEQAANERRVYYPEMNDSTAMSAVFPTRQVDTTYLGAGPNVGEIADIQTRWAWKADNLDSLRARYPDATTIRSTASPIPVYYELGKVSRSPSKYEVGYVGELPRPPHPAQGELGPNSGLATFLKDNKGWYLASNVYNTLATGKGASAVEAKSENANERFFTLHWSEETHIGGDMMCDNQAYKNLTFYGSSIMEVPRGQVWVPVAGKSKPSAKSILYTWVQIESNDENTNNPCYFGTLRKLPENLSKNVALAKDEFHKYYGGAKLRFWGQTPYNEITMLVMGPGPIPSNNAAAPDAPEPAPQQPVATVPAREIQTDAEQGMQKSSATPARSAGAAAALPGLFGAPGETHEFAGNVGKMKAHYSLRMDNSQGLTGSYYYDSKPAKVYALEGKLQEGGNLVLSEYTGNTKTATCALNLSGGCYTGQMRNTDGRSFNMNICK